MPAHPFAAICSFSKPLCNMGLRPEPHPEGTISAVFVATIATMAAMWKVRVPEDAVPKYDDEEDEVKEPFKDVAAMSVAELEARS